MPQPTPPPRSQPRPWPQLSPAQQQQLAQHWAQLLQRIQRPAEKEKPRADKLVR